MRDWRLSLRRGLLPLLSEDDLAARAAAIRENRPDLTHGCTTCPPPEAGTAHREVQSACLAGWCAMRRGARTVLEVWDGFHRVLSEIDARCGPTGSALMIRAWDRLPRADVRARVLEEVEAELARRKGAA
jgi:hypothetical protein